MNAASVNHLIRARHSGLAVLCATAILGIGLGALSAGPADAAEALSTDISAAGFALGSVAQPTNFSPEAPTCSGEGLNVESGECDSYVVTVRNEGTQGTGVVKVGETDTCQVGTFSGEPTSYTYMWLVGGSEAGEGITYTPSAEGAVVQCEVIATNASGDRTAAVSAALRTLPLPATQAPALVVAGGRVEAPTMHIDGGEEVKAEDQPTEDGQTLVCEHGKWEATLVEPKEQGLAYEYRWLIDGSEVSGAHGPAYTLPSEYEYENESHENEKATTAGKTVQCETGTRVEGGGASSATVLATSSDTGVVTAYPHEIVPPHLPSEELTLADAPSVSGDAVTLSDTHLPGGVTATAVAGGAGLESGHQKPSESPLKCELAPVPSCRLPEALPSGGMLQMRVFVTVQQRSGELEANQAQARAAGVPTRFTTQEPSGKVTPTPISSSEPVFGFQDFSFQTFGINGLPDTQAGDHPNAVSVSFNLPVLAGSTRRSPRLGKTRSVRVDLPLGLIGDPQATPRCPEYDLSGASTILSNCPADTLVGYLGFESELATNAAGEDEPIYNVTPQAGYPAEFATKFLGREVLLFANVIPAPTGGGYDVQVTVPGITRYVPITASTLTFFGDPAQRSGTGQAQAFFTNPDACGSNPTARIEADTYAEPGNYRSMEAPLYGPGEAVEDCSLLQFAPTLEAQPEPESRQVDTPAGYEVTLKVPQTPNTFPTLATAELKNATVTMPAGVAVSPSAANGLQGCSQAQVSLEGREGHLVSVEEVNGAGHEDAQEHLTPGHCPQASQIGSVEIVTPLLEAPLKGHVYLAEPQCGGAGQPECTEAAAEEGKLFGLYLEVQGSGVIVKLPGSVEAGGYGPHSQQTGLAPGQLRATFDENPQLPFSELKLKFNNGPRAPLANPQACGTYDTSSSFEAWSAETSSYTSPAFTISGCAGATPFTPAFSAGTTSTGAGAYTNFTTTFSRTDGQQDLAGITVNTPPGLLGMLSHVALCGEPQAQAGTCGPQSQIGTTTVTAGAGSEPYTLHGRVYLTTSYAGQPFGLSIVVPAVAGPFNLGNEVVRASIAVNPTTSVLTITSAPLPQSKDGVPFRLQTINVEVNRPGFMFNPTNCSAQAVSATISGTGGAVVSASTPFAASNCATLPFKPSFTVSTAGKASKPEGASLDVKIAQKPGEANIHKVDVALPLALPSRLTTLQKACSEAQFAANPAGCPEASDVGMATAITPVLKAPLTGPAYLVSHGGAAFPDLVIVLQADEQGGHVRIDLVGNTDIKHGITYSRFETVPDAPISSFELKLPEGKYSVLGTNLPASANYSLCGQSLVMPTTIIGQNGAQVAQSTKIAVTGCGPTVKVTAHRLKGKTLILTVKTSANGRVRISGKDLKTTSTKSLKAGTHQIKVPLTKAGTVARKHHRKIKLRARLVAGKQAAVTAVSIKL